MDKALADISRFLSYVLRHEPEAIGLSLDPEGWAEIDSLIAQANIPITHALLYEAVEKNDKKRFALSNDRRFVRAVQGHSIDINLGLEPSEPPETLYHGTAEKFMPRIQEDGLSPQERKYVHLSTDVQTAIKVGQRHGTPVVLSIPARSMYHDGHPFFCAQNGVWLTSAVPAWAISVQSP